MGYLIFALVLVTQPLLAQEIHFEANLDRTLLGQSDPLRLTLSIVSDESLSHVPAPKISLVDFHVEGPAISTRMEMINFNTTFRRELSYTLFAKRTGKIVIGPASITIGGKVYHTRPVQVEISKGSKSRSVRSNAAGQSGDFRLEDHLFVLARSDRKRAYVGQQITVDYDLFYRFRLHNVGFKDIPTFAGFWIKELFVAQQLQEHREVFNDIPFNVAPLRRVALFPTSAGTHDIDPLVISCEIPAQRTRRGRSINDFFSSDPFFGRTQSTMLQSEALQIEVLPLPEAGRPDEFAGAVGHFQLHAHAQPTHVPVGDPVTLRVEIVGQGNLAAIQTPKIQGAEGVKIYDPKMEEDEQIVSGIYGGKRTFEYILIPEVGGVMEVPPVRFAYFDPFEEKYKLLQSESIFIHSEGEIAAADVESYGLSRKDIEAVGDDIRHIKPDVQNLGGTTSLYASGLFWALQAGLPLAFIALLFYQRHQQRLEGDMAYARRRRARGEADKRLKRAEQWLQAGETTLFYGEIHGAVLAFLADCLNLSATGLTGEACGEKLRQRQVDERSIKALQTWLESCDYARFAPGDFSRTDMEKMRLQAEKLIDDLEKKI